METVAGHPQLSPVRFGMPALAAPVRVAIMLCAAGGFAFLCQVPVWHQSHLYVVGNVAATLGLFGSGIYVRRWTGTSTLSIALMISGLAWSVQWVGAWNIGPLPMISGIANTTSFVAGAWALVRHPIELKNNLKEKSFLIFYLLMIPLTQVAMWLAGRPEYVGFSAGAWWLPDWWASQDAFATSQRLTLDLAYVAVAWYVVAIFSRLIRMSSMDREVMYPVSIGFGVFALVSISVPPENVIPTSTLSSSWFHLALAGLTVPAGFVIGAVRKRLQHASVADSFHRDLARNAPAVDAVRNALRSAFRDESLEVYYWAPHSQTHVDGDGRPMASVGSVDRIVRNVRSATGEPLALIVGDSYLNRHAASLDTAVNASTIALENARLQASVRSQLEEVRESRARIVEAGLEERRRIERDLHDGIQQRLLAAVARLGTARLGDHDAALSAITAASLELRSTLQELRDLAHGIHPAELRQFGLRAAVDSVVERLPVAVNVEGDGERFNPTVEAIAYFVVSEALANAVKHSAAGLVLVRWTVDNGVLLLTVSDDGAGGADMAEGSGIRGLADRVNAANGTLSVISTVGAGTTLSAEIPV